MGKADTCDGKQTPGRPAAQGGTARRRTHTWLLAKSVAPLQETGKQELPEHLSAVGDTAFKQHSVSILQGMTMRCLCLRESDWAVGVVGNCFGMDAVRRLDSARQGNYNYSYEQWKPRVAPYSTKIWQSTPLAGIRMPTRRRGDYPPLREFMNRANRTTGSSKRLPSGINEPASQQALPHTHVPLNLTLFKGN